MSKWNIEKARERKHTDEKFTSLPQWITGSRLLKAGEKIGFDFYIPEGMKYGSVEVFPHYLEKADPGNSFIAGGGLAWLEDMESESQKLKFVNGYASISYKPDSPGNYIAKWIAGDEIFYRYFSVVENDSVVFNFSTFAEPDPSPSMHATGIPLDYRLPEEKFDLQDPVFKKLFDYHRHYGSLIVPEFPDTPDISTEERVRLYGKGLEKVRGLIPDINDTRSIRVEMCHYLDKGYTETFMRLGIVDHCGLCAANGNSWLGMPEF
ncbi:MAG: hypothetical protein FIA99_08725, partial [Ruminiclostridium sp.]|nr:hypothetical protein [Ruminiclostridium sp.]